MALSFVFLLSLCAYVLRITVFAATAPSPPAWTPLEYRLHLRLHWNASGESTAPPAHADGQVLIRMACVRATDTIVLNSNDLRIDKRSLRLEDEASGQRVRIKHLEHYPARLQIKVVAESELLVGANYSLRVDYTAPITDDQTGGLYLSGDKKKYVATQLQKIDGSRLLPCFDEPRFRSVFTLTVLHLTASNLTALSNAPAIETRELEDGWTRTKFESTPLISTYLFAIYVGAPDCLTAEVLGTPIRLFYGSLGLEAAKKALELVIRSFEFYTAYFNLSYPLSKLDVVIVDHLRVVGMEHWGLVFLKLKETLQQDSRRLAISHEMSHMWGNLVVPNAWDDLWFFEGACERAVIKFLASIDEDPFVKADLDAQLLVKTLDNRFVYEANRLHQPAAKLADLQHSAANREKSPIVYEKASALLGMLERTVGEDAFDRSTRLFLRRNAFGTGDSLHFADCVDEVLAEDGSEVFSAAGLTARRFVDEWRKSQGYPIVTITRWNESHLQVASETANPLGLDGIEEQTWSIPLFLRSFDGTRREVRMLPSDFDSEDEFLIPADVFVEAGGYYRVLYKDDLFERLLDEANRLDDLTKTITLDNARFFAFNNVVPPRVLIRSLDRLVTDRLPNCIRIYVHTSSILHYLLNGHSKREELDEFLMKAGAELYDRSEKIAYKPTDSCLQDKRAQYLGIGFCSWDYKPCTQRAVRDYETMRVDCADKRTGDSCNKIPPALRWSAYSMAVQRGDLEDLNFFNTQRRMAEGEELTRLSSALFFTSNRTVQKELLQSLVYGGCAVLKSINRGIFRMPLVSHFLHSILAIWKEEVETRKLSPRVLEQCGKHILKYSLLGLSRTEEDLNQFNGLNCTSFLSTQQCDVIKATIQTRLAFVKQLGEELERISLQTSD
ncbi:Aminopeptidase [Aphelenchoides fujianensis]|nr:Aminopeptidase [Aphelenchoides fujianensis]